MFSLTESFALKDMKVANAVKCGRSEEFYFNSNQFTLTVFGGIYVKIERKSTKEVTYTSLFNAIYFNLLEENDGPSQPSKKAVTGTKKSA
jgi:hypothetical protein